MRQKLNKKQQQDVINWDVNAAQWHSAYCRIKRANLLQSYDYITAMAQLNNQRPRLGMITIGGQHAGLFSTLEAGIFKKSVHAVILDRGPLWFDGYETPQNIATFMDSLSRHYPRRFGRKMRFIPEYPDAQIYRNMMQQHGFKSMTRDGYQTIWLDTRPDPDYIRANMGKKWRNALSKAEKSGLKTIISDDGEHLAWLLQNYVQDKEQKNYDGASLRTLMKLFASFSRGKNMLQATAIFDGEPIAAIVVLKHGIAATYQIGYTSDTGREKCAHHLLLWQAIQELRQRGVQDVDLGGTNERDADGVRKFKEGLGGEKVETLGLYN